MLRNPDNVQYFAAVMYNKEYVDNPDKIIQKIFGNAVLKSLEFNFDHTKYYEPEMGVGLKKFFYAFGETQEPGFLPEMKHKSIKLENSIAQEGKRIINIDPGYLALEKVVVASTKNFTHRIYLGNCIFGDVQLVRQKSTYKGLPWTYADYLRNEVKDFFNELSKRVGGK